MADKAARDFVNNVNRKEEGTKAVAKYKIVNFLPGGVLELEKDGHIYKALMSEGYINGEYFYTTKGRLYEIPKQVEDPDGILSIFRSSEEDVLIGKILGYIGDEYVTVKLPDGTVKTFKITDGTIQGATFIVPREKRIDPKDPLKDFRKATGQEASKGKLKGIIGGYGVFDVHGLTVFEKLQTGDENAFHSKIGAYTSGENPDEYEAPEEVITFINPLWFGPIEHVDGLKLANYCRRTFSGLYVVQADAENLGVTSALLNATGFVFFDRFSTVLTEEEKEWEGGASSPYYTEQKFQELAGALSIGSSLSIPISLTNQLGISGDMAILSEGVGAFEYLLRFEPGNVPTTPYQKNASEFFGTYVGNTWQFGDGVHYYCGSYGSRNKARRLIFYDKENGTFHLLYGGVFTWLIDGSDNYHGYRDYYTLLEYGLATNRPYAKLHGGFIVNSIDIDVINHKATLTGETRWLDTPVECSDFEGIRNAIIDFAKYSSITTTINHLNLDQLPSGLIILYDETCSTELAQIPVTAADYTGDPRGWATWLDQGTETRLLFPTPTFKEFYVSEGNNTPFERWQQLDSGITVQNALCSLAIMLGKFKPAYVVDIPENFTPLLVNEEVNNLLLPAPYRSDMKLVIPHLEWLSLTGEPAEGTKAVHSFLKPSDDPTQKPIVETIVLDLSSLDIPEDGRYDVTIYLKEGDKVIGMIVGGGVQGSWLPFQIGDEYFETSESGIDYIDGFASTRVYASTTKMMSLTPKYIAWGVMTARELLPLDESVKPWFDWKMIIEAWAYVEENGEWTWKQIMYAGDNEPIAEFWKEEDLAKYDRPTGTDITAGSYAVVSGIEADDLVARGYPSDVDFSWFDDEGKASLVGTGYFNEYFTEDDVRDITKVDVYVPTITASGTPKYVYSRTIIGYDIEKFTDELLGYRLPLLDSDFVAYENNGVPGWLAPRFVVWAERMVSQTLVVRWAGYLENLFFRSVEDAVRYSTYMGLLGSKKTFYPATMLSYTFCDYSGMILPIPEFDSTPVMENFPATDNLFIQEVLNQYGARPSWGSITGIKGYVGRVLTGGILTWNTPLKVWGEDPTIRELYTIPINLTGFVISISQCDGTESYRYTVDLPTPITQTPSATFTNEDFEYAVVELPIKYLRIIVRHPLLRTNKVFLHDDLNARVFNATKYGEYRNQIDPSIIITPNGGGTVS